MPTKSRRIAELPAADAGAQPKLLKPKKVNSLAEAQKIADEFVSVPIMLNGQTMEVDVRRLRPDEDCQLAAMLESVVPPIKQGKTPEDDRIDFQNADFLKRKAEAEIGARALAIYWCVPIFSGERPGLTRKDEIVGFVQGKLTNSILNLLYAETRTGGIRIPEGINFFSDGQSPQS